MQIVFVRIYSWISIRMSVLFFWLLAHNVLMVAKLLYSVLLFKIRRGRFVVCLTIHFSVVILTDHCLLRNYVVQSEDDTNFKLMWAIVVINKQMPLNFKFSYQDFCNSKIYCEIVLVFLIKRLIPRLDINCDLEINGARLRCL